MPNILFETIFGSKLYGTQTADSDTDYKAVYAPSLEDLTLGKVDVYSSIHVGNKDDQHAKSNNIDSENNYIRKKEKIELSLLQFRKNICLPENAKEKAQYEEEMAEWLGIESCVVSPLTEEEEERLKYLEKKLSDADNGI